MTHFQQQIPVRKTQEFNNNLTLSLQFAFSENTWNRILKMNCLCVILCWALTNIFQLPQLLTQFCKCVCPSLCLVTAIELQKDNTISCSLVCTVELSRPTQVEIGPNTALCDHTAKHRRFKRTPAQRDCQCAATCHDVRLNMKAYCHNYRLNKSNSCTERRRHSATDLLTDAKDCKRANLPIQMTNPASPNTSSAHVCQHLQSLCVTAHEIWKYPNLFTPRNASKRNL